MLSSNTYTAFTASDSMFEDETPKVIVFHNEYSEANFAGYESRHLLQGEANREVNVVKRMRHLICIASIGGFLSGYNTGVLSGALLPLSRVFSLSSLQGKSHKVDRLSFPPNHIANEYVN